MPQGKFYSKNLKKWVDKETERKIDYDQYDDETCALLISYWRWYPDKFVDLCEAETPDYSQEIIQRINLRAFCRYQQVFITGSRGTTKTHEALKGRLVMGVLWPGITMQYFGPNLKQTAAICSKTFQALQKNYPILCSFWDVIADSEERFVLKTKYGSEINISTMRGSNASSVLAEECAQQESGKQFDHETFKEVVLPAIRLKRRINREDDVLFPQIQKQYITSAGIQQNESFEIRKQVIKCVGEGRSAFVVDYPYQIAILSGIRDITWAEDLKRTLAPEQWSREMLSLWTGSSENPVISDLVLTESKTLLTMEYQHCGDPNALYVIGYDNSYRDGSNNAKCAAAVFKCTEQDDFYKKDHYLKELVYISDNPPPRESAAQARMLKQLWWRFTASGKHATYIAIDARAYGTSIVEDLHKDLGDGLPPLCCMNHEHKELELDGALPVIYPIVATSGFTGTHDSDGAMLEYAEREWEHRNVRILTTNLYDGIKAYKLRNKIKTDDLDRTIARPYIKTRELCTQISNLIKKVTGYGISEQRISKSIQRDMWSAVKYALRVIRILEDERRIAGIKKKNPWEDWSVTFVSGGTNHPNGGNTPTIKPRCIGRRGGNIL